MKSHYRQLFSIKLWALIITGAFLSGTGLGASQLSQFGITWEFDRDYPVGQFANGDWWVVGPVKITGISPGSAVSNGRTMNGSMLNPMASNDKLGYDSELTGYDATLNVALNVSASAPLTLQPHSSLVSSISVTAAAAKPQIQCAAILTVLNAAAPAGSFRPPYCGTDKTIRFNKSQLDYSLLDSLQKVPATPRLKQAVGDGQTASVERMFERPWIDHRRGWYARWMHPKENMPDYQREMSTQIGEAALMLHLDYTNSEKETLLIRFVQLGIDLFGIVENGGWRNWEPDGGCGSGRKWPILFAGLILGDSAMANIGTRPIDNPYFGEDAQTFYVTQEDIDLVHTDGFADGTPQPSHDYSQSHLGLPEWGIRHATNPYKDNVSWGASYRTCCTANAWGGFVLACHIMGTKGMWKHDALFDYQDRYMGIEVPGTFNRQQSKFAEQMWDTYRAGYGSVWPNKSSNQAPQANAGPDQTVADNDGDGTVQVTLNASASSDSDGTITGYIWKNNGVQIASGVKPAVTLTLGQHTLSLEVTDDKGAKDTDTVVITVQALDTAAPQIVSITSLSETVTVLFDEILDPLSTETTANYSINNAITVSSATLESDRVRVTLTVSPLTEDTVYTLTVSGIKDAAGNAMKETSENFNYTGGQVSFWRFDEGAGTVTQDVLEAANTGTLVNGPVWMPGHTQYGLGFDAYDDAVEITTGNLNPLSGTIELWINPNGFLNTKHFLFGHAVQPWSNRIQLYCDHAGTLCLGLGNNSGLNNNICTIQPNQWQHVVLSWNRPNYTVYVNGLAQASGTYTGLDILNDYADIGNNGNPAARAEAFDGILDEVKVYDRALSPDEVLSLFNQNPELLFAPIGDKVVDENSTLTFAVQTSDPSVAVSLTSHNLPGSPALVNSTFTWTSTYDCSGVYECTFTAVSPSFEDSETITITVNNVNRAPVLAAIGNKQVNEGSALTFAVSAADADGDTLSYTAAPLPAGAAFGNGTFTWTPLSGQVGDYNVTFTASDGHLQDSETLTITVLGPAQTQLYDLQVSSSKYRTSPKLLEGNIVAGDICVFLTPETGIKQVLFYLDNPGMSGTARQVENSAPYDFAGGSAAAANIFDTTQVSDGAHTITAKIIRTDGTTHIVNGTFYVANASVPVNQPPVLALIPNQAAEEGKLLTFTVLATDPDGDVLTYAAVNLPAGAVFANRTFTWTPAAGQAGTYTITIGVTDGSLVDSQAVTITVTPATTAPAELVGYWNLDQAAGTVASDLSTSGNNGILVNGAVWTAGKTNGAVSFDGSNDAVEVKTVNWKADAGTVLLWTKPRAFYNGKHFLFGHATQPWSNRIQLYADRKGDLYLGMGSSSKCAQRIATLPVNTWTSIGLTWNAGTYTVYVNGTPLSTGTYSGLTALNSFCDIGNNGNQLSRIEGFDGVIDEVRVFNRAVTSGEILQLLSQ